MLLKVAFPAALSVVIATGGAVAETPGGAGMVAETLCNVLEPGDLVFKGASTAIWTELAASWSDPADRRWGHVGLVLTVQNQCNASLIPGYFSSPGETLVVHADTGTGNPAETPAPGEEIGKVRAVALADFLSDVDQVGIFRLNLSLDQRARMLAHAGKAAEDQLPFDRGYNLASENNAYCTELIWRALSAGLEEDAIPVKSSRMGRTYVALSDLSLHPLAKEVMVLDWRAPPRSDRETEKAETE